MNNIVNIDSVRPHITTDIQCKECGHKWIAVYPEPTKAIECPGCGVFVNEYGVKVLYRRCRTCGSEFTVVPYPKNLDAWQDCLAVECGSYDEQRDVDKIWDDITVVVDDGENDGR